MPADARRRREPRHRLDAWRRRTERRWDVDQRATAPDDDTVPEVLAVAAEAGLPPELLDLARELAVAGGRARARAIRDVAAGPDPAFAAALRGRLVAQLARRPTDAAVPEGTPSSRTDDRRAPFARLGAPRWTALGVVTTLAFVAIGMTAEPTPRPTAQAHLTSGAGVAISGVAGDRPGAPGAGIVPGDALVVAPGGGAVVTAGTAEIRLGGGAVLALDRIDAGEVTVVQRAGRAWIRIGGENGASLVTVRTGGVTWTARAAAFDLARTPAADGAGGTVSLVVVQGSVALHGPDVEATIPEGRRSVVTLGGDAPDVSIGSAQSADLGDPWLVRNAALDRDQGRPLGVLADLVGSPAVTIP
jgi:hypothetical protein